MSSRWNWHTVPFIFTWGKGTKPYATILSPVVVVRWGTNRKLGLQTGALNGFQELETL
jgi:hypothetical protein